MSEPLNIIKDIQITDIEMSDSIKDSLAVLTFITTSKINAKQLNDIFHLRDYQIKINDQDELHTKFDIIFSKNQHHLVSVMKKNINAAKLIESKGYYVVAAYRNDNKLILDQKPKLLLPQG